MEADIDLDLNLAEVGAASSSHLLLPAPTLLRVPNETWNETSGQVKFVPNYYSKVNPFLTYLHGVSYGKNSMVVFLRTYLKKYPEQSDGSLFFLLVKRRECKIDQNLQIELDRLT